MYGELERCVTVTPEKRELFAAAAALRYDVYVREMGRNDPGANHEQGTIVDVLDHDPRSRIFCEVVDGKVVGTVRVSVAVPKFYRDLYGLRGADGDISLTTRFSVHPEYRRSGVAARLVRRCFRFAAEQGVLLDFIDATPPTDRLYLRMGYLPLGAALEHPNYGTVVPMVIVPAATSYLTRIQSIFADLSRELYTSTDFDRARERLALLGYRLDTLMAQSALSSARRPRRARPLRPVPGSPGSTAPARQR